MKKEETNKRCKISFLILNNFFDSNNCGHHPKSLMSLNVLNLVDHVYKTSQFYREVGQLHPLMKPWFKYTSKYRFKPIGLRRSQPSQHLLAQGQQWKHQNNMLNLFKVNNKGTRTTSLTSFWYLYLAWSQENFFLCGYHLAQGFYRYGIQSPSSIVDVCSLAITRAMACGQFRYNKLKWMKTGEYYVSNKYPFKRQMFRLSQVKLQACQAFYKITNTGHML